MGKQHCHWRWISPDSSCGTAPRCMRRFKLLSGRNEPPPFMPTHETLLTSARMPTCSCTGCRARAQGCARVVCRVRSSRKRARVTYCWQEQSACPPSQALCESLDCCLSKALCRHLFVIQRGSLYFDQAVRAQVEAAPLDFLAVCLCGVRGDKQCDIAVFSESP